MYATRLLAVIHVIWLKGGQLSYIAKKLFSFVVLAEQGIKINYVALTFNNLYSRLWDLSTPTKLGASRDNTEFGATQVVDILL
jgi:hypothetical protein